MSIEVRTRAEQDRIDYVRDQTIAERIEQLEFMLQFITDRDYRRQLVREYCALTTDPDEAQNG